MKLDLKQIFHLVVALLPSRLGAEISKAETILTSGADKREKVIAAVTSSVAIANILGQDMVTNPRYKAAVTRLNDAIVAFANDVAQIQGATDGDTTNIARANPR